MIERYITNHSDTPVSLLMLGFSCWAAVYEHFGSVGPSGHFDLPDDYVVIDYLPEKLMPGHEGKQIAIASELVRCYAMEELLRLRMTQDEVDALEALYKERGHAVYKSAELRGRLWSLRKTMLEGVEVGKWEWLGGRKRPKPVNRRKKRPGSSAEAFLPDFNPLK